MTITTPSHEIITTLQLIFREVVSFVSRYSMSGKRLWDWKQVSKCSWIPSWLAFSSSYRSYQGKWTGLSRTNLQVDFEFEKKGYISKKRQRNAQLYDILIRHMAESVSLPLLLSRLSPFAFVRVRVPHLRLQAVLSSHAFALARSLARSPFPSVPSLGPQPKRIWGIDSERRLAT